MVVGDAHEFRLGRVAGGWLIVAIDYEEPSVEVWTMDEIHPDNPPAPLGRVPDGWAS